MNLCRMLQAHGAAVPGVGQAVIAAAVWGRWWKGHSIASYCDNTTVVAVLNACLCCNKHLMHLLRCLFLYEAYWKFSIRGKHIAGSCNGRADDIFRNDLATLLSKVPGANNHLPHIPAALPRLMLSQELDGISATWIQLFKLTLNRA